MDFVKVWGISRCEMFGECARVKSQALDVSLIVLVLHHIVCDGYILSRSLTRSKMKTLVSDRVRWSV